MSFDQISTQCPRAAAMLSLMAVLDRQGIQESLLREDSDQNVDFTLALGTLLAFSLIKPGRDGSGYELHRLVQLATQKWLKIQGTTYKWQEKALSVVADMFPNGIFETWTTCEYLLPHAETVLRYGDKNNMCTEKLSNLLSRVAYFDGEHGRYGMACVRDLAAFEMRKKIFGLDHASTLVSMNNLAVTYRKQNRWEEAEKLQIQVVEARKRVLGAEHPDTLMSMANLAIVYDKQDRHTEAIALMESVLDLRTKSLGANHPATRDAAEWLKEWLNTRSQSDI